MFDKLDTLKDLIKRTRKEQPAAGIRQRGGRSPNSKRKLRR
jgi:hypothetical protein